MREVTYNERILLGDRWLPIYTKGLNGKVYGCYVEPLRALERQMTAMLSHHANVLMIRVDIHVKEFEGTLDNKLMTDFMHELRKGIKKAHRVKRIGYFWVREIETVKHQHYHLLIMVDADKVNTPKGIFIECEKISRRTYELAKPSLPPNPYVKVKRGDSETFDRMFFRASYLTKERGKNRKGKYANNYGSSNIALNEKKHITPTSRTFISGIEYLKQIEAEANKKKIA